MAHRSNTNNHRWTLHHPTKRFRWNLATRGRPARSLIGATYLLVAMIILAGCGEGAQSRSNSATADTAANAGSSFNLTTPTASGSDSQSAASAAQLGGATTPTATPSDIPNFDHIYVIVMENKESTDIVGSDRAPYLNSLIAQNGLASNYTGVAHPSQPNYLALWAGSTFGITDDDIHNLDGPSLADQLEAAGKSWSVYAENYPVAVLNPRQACFIGPSASDGEDGSGTYTRKHNPAMSFTDLSTSTARCGQHITDLSHFDAAAVNFSFIVPNACHDMHDCAVPVGDQWLQQWLPQHILNTPTWNNTNSAIFIVWDEGDTSNGGGGTVPLIVISHETPAGFTSPMQLNHYSLLLTVERSWGIVCLRSSCNAPDLGAFFKKP